jgi:hypothetical protein
MAGNRRFRSSNPGSSNALRSANESLPISIAIIFLNPAATGAAWAPAPNPKLNSCVAVMQLAAQVLAVAERDSRKRCVETETGDFLGPKFVAPTPFTDVAALSQVFRWLTDRQ